MSGLVAGRFVVVEYEKRDLYGRVVGNVLLSGEDVNLRQIKARPAGDLRREATLPGYLLQGGQLGLPGSNQRPWETRTGWETERSHQGLMGLSLGATLQGGANSKP